MAVQYVYTVYATTWAFFCSEIQIVDVVPELGGFYLPFRGQKV